MSDDEEKPSFNVGAPRTGQLNRSFSSGVVPPVPKMSIAISVANPKAKSVLEAAAAAETAKGSMSSTSVGQNKSSRGSGGRGGRVRENRSGSNLRERKVLVEEKALGMEESSSGGQKGVRIFAPVNPIKELVPMEVEIEANAPPSCTPVKGSRAKTLRKVTQETVGSGDETEAEGEIEVSSKALYDGRKNGGSESSLRGSSVGEGITKSASVGYSAFDSSELGSTTLDKSAECKSLLRAARIKMQEGPLRWKSMLDPVTLPFNEASPESFEARKRSIVREYLTKAIGKKVVEEENEDVEGDWFEKVENAGIKTSLAEGEKGMEEEEEEEDDDDIFAPGGKLKQGGAGNLNTFRKALEDVLETPKIAVEGSTDRSQGSSKSASVHKEKVAGPIPFYSHETMSAVDSATPALAFKNVGSGGATGGGAVRSIRNAPWLNGQLLLFNLPTALPLQDGNGESVMPKGVVNDHTGESIREKAASIREGSIGKVNIREDGSVTLEMGSVPFSVTLGVTRQQCQQLAISLPRDLLRGFKRSLKGKAGADDMLDGDAPLNALDTSDGESEGREEITEERDLGVQSNAASAASGWVGEEEEDRYEEEEEDKEGGESSAVGDGAMRRLLIPKNEKRAFVLLGSIAQTLNVSPDLECLLANPRMGVTNFDTQTLLNEFDSLGYGEGSEKCSGKPTKAKGSVRNDPSK